MGLLNEWLDYLEQWVGRGAYVYGAQGQRANEVGNVKAWIERKSKSRETAKRAWSFYQQLTEELEPSEVRFFDCSGLAMWFFQDLKRVTKSDASANGLWRGCTALKKSALKPGDFTFIDTDGRKTHVGYVARNGQEVEARASGYGVEMLPLNARPWTHFGRSKWLKSEIESEVPLPDVPADAKRTVEEWQKILLLWDPNCLPTFGADGKYGDETDAALRAMIEDAEAFRRANGR